MADAGQRFAVAARRRELAEDDASPNLRDFGVGQLQANHAMEYFLLEFEEFFEDEVGMRLSLHFLAENCLVGERPGLREQILIRA